MSVSVEPVAGRRDLKQFVDLPFRLHGEGTPWVPPLRMERRRFLDRRKNPYFDHAEGEYWLARRDGDVVGRITAQHDTRWDEFQGGNDGMFGFFEAIDDQEVADALVGAACDWLRSKGRERVLGPMNFTLNDECGLLIEGFDLHPMVLEPWHPPYYRDLLEAAGLEKAHDTLIWELFHGRLKEGDEFHPMIEAAAKQARENGVVVRPMRKREMEAEVTRFMDVYNEAWGQNWGFVPVTEAEVAFQAGDLKPVLSEDWAMLAEKDGEVIGAALSLPDVNQLFARLNGSLLPFGWFWFARGMFHPQGVSGVLPKRLAIDRIRIFALGVKSEHQHTGAAAALFDAHNEAAVRTGVPGGDAGWILESNDPMNRAMEGMGGTVVKRYRIFEKSLEPAPVGAEAG